MIIFPKFCWAFMKHIIRWNTGKKIKLFPELFTNTIFEYREFRFFMHQTIQETFFLSFWGVENIVIMAMKPTVRLVLICIDFSVITLTSRCAFTSHDKYWLTLHLLIFFAKYRVKNHLCVNTICNDIYVLKCWVDLSFNWIVILDFLFFCICKLQNRPKNLEFRN